MKDPGAGAAGIAWGVSGVLDKVALALKDTVKLPQYCGQLNVYVLRIRPLVQAAEASSFRSTLRIPQGNCDTQVKQWVRQVKLVLDEADVLVAKCGALPAGKLDSIMQAITRLKLSRKILRLTRRLKELASTEATWACLAKQEAIRVSVVAQGDLVERILKGTDDNQTLVKEVKNLIMEKFTGVDGSMDEAVLAQVKQLGEAVRSFEERLSHMNQAVVDEMKLVKEELRADMHQNANVLTDMWCTKFTELGRHVSTESRDLTRFMTEGFSQWREVQMEVLNQNRLQTEEMVRQVEIPNVPGTSSSGDMRGRKEGGRKKGLAVLISMEKGKPWVSEDRAILETLAHGIEFDVKVVKDRTAAELGGMMRNLEASPSRKVLAECDSFLCFVIADVGTDGREFIVDEHGESVYLEEDIVRHFLLCPYLSGKPKVFILVGCRRLVKHLHGEKPDDSRYSVLSRPALPSFPQMSESIIAFIMPNTNPQARSFSLGSPFVSELVERWRLSHELKGAEGQREKYLGGRWRDHYLFTIEGILESSLRCRGSVQSTDSRILSKKPVLRSLLLFASWVYGFLRFVFSMIVLVFAKGLGCAKAGKCRQRRTPH